MSDFIVSPASYLHRFDGIIGDNFEGMNKNFIIKNNSQNSLNWTISKNENWLEISSYEGILNAGESKTINIEPVEGYGEYLDGLVTTVPPTQVPATVKVGDVLQSQGDRGTMNVTVKEINEEGVKLDANHPLAGKNLVFEVEVLEII